MGLPPPSVRWLTSSAAAAVRLRPRLPEGAAGALVYRFAGPGEADTAAAQLEALDGNGRRLIDWRYWDPDLRCEVVRATKRPSVSGSDFARGRRVFQAAAAGKPGRGQWIAEGPLDALAVVHLAHQGVIGLCGAAVIGVAGVGGFTPRACHDGGPVTLAADPDAAGDRAAVRLGIALRLQGRRVQVRRPPDGMNWDDVARETALEREAIQN